VADKAIRIYINNTRTFQSSLDFPHHHDFMLANGCMACAYDDQGRVDVPSVGDLIALYANRLGIVAFGYASERTAYLDDERVGNCPTRIRKLDDFTLIGFPVRQNEFKTGVRQTCIESTKTDKDFPRYCCKGHFGLPIRPCSKTIRRAHAICSFYGNSDRACEGLTGVRETNPVEEIVEMAGR
jgi:hypothetical protein